jgi:hypothetical protein
MAQNGDPVQRKKPLCGFFPVPRRLFGYSCLMTIEHIVEIPSDRRITLELPADIPSGTARVKLSVKPEQKRRPKTFMESLGPLSGCLKESPAFEGDPVEIQRQMRSEWDRPWDKHG